MSKQKPRESIDKASWTMMEGIKDAVSANLAAASSRGQLDVKGETLSRLLQLVNASIEEGYHRSSRTFGKACDAALAAAALPPLEAPSTKKKSG